MGSEVPVESMRSLKSMGSMRKLAGRVAVVTGGAQGIGKAISIALLRAGASVVMSDMDEEAGHETELELSAGEIPLEAEEPSGPDTPVTPAGTIQRAIPTGPRVAFIRTDVGDPDQIKSLFDDVRDRFGGVHIVVNNAGIGATKPLEELEVSTFDRVIAVNLRSALLTAKYALPMMKVTGGAIVNIASTRAFMSEPNTESYAASKGGIVALTHSLAVSLGPHKIRVNSISPGWIDTSSWQKSSRRRQTRLSAADHAQHPAGRVGRPEDIARAVLFLVDPEADFITGANIVVDGGMTVKMIYEE